MAMASGFFVLNWRDIIDPTQLTVDFTSSGLIVCLFDNSFDSGDFDTITAHAGLNGELTTGGGYTQHNKTLSGITPTVGLGNAGQLKYTWTVQNYVQWTSASFTSYGMTISLASTNEPLVAVSFAGAYTATSGNFTVTAHADGIWYLDLVP